LLIKSLKFIIIDSLAYIPDCEFLTHRLVSKLRQKMLKKNKKPSGLKTRGTKNENKSRG